MQVRKGLRYLGGAPALLTNVGVNHPLGAYSRRFIKYHLRYRDFMFKAAEKVINILGGQSSYTSAHVRRNDLQYKNVFIGAESSIQNMQAKLKEGETIYLATDETEAGFFEPFKQRGYKVLTLSSIKATHPDIWDTIGNIHPKYEGMIEQIICASGRNFFGTPFSTFSAYIFRLRGYLYDSSDFLFHTQSYSNGEGKRKSRGGYLKDADFF
mmetsp:Transcript_10123/g.11624  ORF Transcript_10123/g.11624 Transcript_10123/m.11624 type:complete len:211 (-) Transcript_10123:339-971(-)